MKIRQFLPLITMLSLAPVIVSGFSDKVDVGPFAIGFTINASLQPTINTSGPIKQSGFDRYGFGIKTISFSPRAINVTIDDYQNSTDVSETRLMNLITDTIKSNSYKIDWNKVSIGSIPGIMAQVQDSESFASYSIAAYSPDGDGKKGKTIVLIESFLSRDVTSSSLKDLKIQRRQL
ncbi:Uncharacterised protein [uncultured archaeon]|nr:Uncharacterised protein [uncultured archaeon]